MDTLFGTRPQRLNYMQAFLLDMQTANWEMISVLVDTGWQAKPAQKSTYKRKCIIHSILVHAVVYTTHKPILLDKQLANCKLENDKCIHCHRLASKNQHKNGHTKGSVSYTLY